MFGGFIAILSVDRVQRPGGVRPQRPQPERTATKPADAAGV